jgi:hypothetical protein
MKIKYQQQNKLARTVKLCFVEGKGKVIPLQARCGPEDG